jgi:hypothetical protein
MCCALLLCAGWSRNVAVEAFVVNIRDAAAPDVEGLVNPLLKRYAPSCNLVPLELPQVLVGVQHIICEHASYWSCSDRTWTSAVLWPADAESVYGMCCAGTTQVAVTTAFLVCLQSRCDSSSCVALWSRQVVVQSTLWTKQFPAHVSGSSVPVCGPQHMLKQQAQLAFATVTQSSTAASCSPHLTGCLCDCLFDHGDRLFCSSSGTPLQARW